MQKYWFKNKKVGIGLEPASWQGWLLTAGLFIGVGFIVINMSDVSHKGDVLRKVVFPILSITFLYMAIVFRTGEKIDWKILKRKQ